MSARNSRPEADAAARRRPWRRRMAIALGVLVLLLVVVRLLLPTAIERGAAWAGPRYLGLPVRIANVDLGLLRGRITVEGLAVGSRFDAVLPEETAPAEQAAAARAPANAATSEPPAPAAVSAPPASGETTPQEPDPATDAPAPSPETPPPDAGAAETPQPAAGEPAATPPAPGEAPPSTPGAPAAAGAPEAAPGEEPLLRWDRVFVEFDWLPLLSRTVRLGALEVDGPRVRLVRERDGRIDPLAHARPTAPPAEEEEEEEPEPAAEPREPWTIELARFALRRPDVRIRDAESGATLVEAGLEELWLDRIGLRGRDVSLAGVGIRDPVLRVRRDFVFAERPAPDQAAPPEPAPPAAEPAPAGGEPAPGYRIEEIAIERAQLTWITEAGPLDLALSLHAQGVTANEGERFPVRLGLEVEEGRLALEGQAGVLPPAFEGRITWQRFPLPPLVAAASPELAPWMRAARSSAELEVAAHLAANGGAPPGVRIAGQLGIDGLSIGDPKGEEVALGWQELGLVIREIRVPLPQDGAPPEATRIDLASVRLLGPTVRYAPPTPALDALLGNEPPGEGEPAADDEDADAPAAEATSEQANARAADAEGADPSAADPDAGAPGAEPAAAGAPLELDLAAFELGEGQLRYEDRSGEKPLAASVDGLGVRASAIALRAAGGSQRVTIGSLAVDGQALGFDDARGAAPRQGAIEGLALALEGIEAAGGGATAVAVGELRLDGQEIRFEDHTVDPVYRGRLRDLAARARGLRFPERVAQSLKVTGASADGGRFELDGRLQGQSGQATLTLTRLALAPFNPYATSAAGYRVEGAASLDTKLSVRGSTYETRNRITLHGLDVSSQNPGDFERRFGIPLDVALALLRDPAGDIALSVPVTVDEQGARTGIGTIVAGALRQALLGALTSPLKMLGALGSGVGGLLGGGDGPAIRPIASEPGRAAPAEGAHERFEGLAKLLGERPQLALRLRGRTGDADRPLVAQRILAERIESGEGLPEIPDGAGFFARRRIENALRERAAGEPGELDPEDEALLARYVAAVDVPEERLAELARARAEALREEIVREAGVDGARLLVGAPAAPGDPGVVLELAAAH